MHVCEFIVDKITNSIEEVSSGKIFETDVMPASYKELSKLYKKDGWKFDWKKECKQEGRQVYKLVRREGGGEIEGVISFAAQPARKCNEMYLIESSPRNLGSGKEFFGVAPNLVAFVCKKSFEYGFDGYVGFIAKTKLISHYEKVLKAIHVGGGKMKINTEAALFLVNSYFRDH